MEAKDIIAQLKKIPLFRDITGSEGESDLMRLVPRVNERIYEAGERIRSQGRVPHRLYLIITGRVQVTHTSDDGKTETSTLQAGNIFGRTGLSKDQYKDVTAQALEQTHILYLAFRELVKIYDESKVLRAQLNGPLKPENAVKLLKTIPMFHNLRDERGEMELYRIAPLLHDQVYGSGEWLFRQGEISDRLILVIEGRIRLTKVDAEGLIHEVGWLKTGDVAGETGLLVGDFHDVLATAEEHARVLYLLREEFAELLTAHHYIQRHLLISETVDDRRKVHSFNWLRDDEWAVLTAQRHWSRLFRRITVPLLFIALLLPALAILVASDQAAVMILGGVIGLTVIILSGVTAWRYLNWRDDYFVVTTQRVVHIERQWPFAVATEETSLDNIQDVYEVRPGLTAHILDYGNLVLQTAGETVDIDMDNISNPSRLRETIFQQIERSKARDILRARGQIRNLLARRLKIEETPQKETPEVVPAPPVRRRMWWLLPISWLWEYLFPPSWIETDEGETIILRRFWLAGLLRYTAAFIPWVLLTFVGGYFLLNSLTNQRSLGWLAVWLIAQVIFLLIFLYYIDDWRNDYIQVTPSHVVLVQQKPLLLGESSRREARLDRIQNLSFQVPGFLGQLFKYGHVQFETAGREGKFELKWVRYPEKVRARISDRQYAYNQQQRRVDAARRQEELLNWFTTYDHLRNESGEI